jgi:hypothetical protein
MENMINILNKTCQFLKCKHDAVYGVRDKRAQFCSDHMTNAMINVILDMKCCMLDCEKEHDFVVDGAKYCMKQCLDESPKVPQD